MSTSAMVPMIAPDGSGGMIPQDRVNDALANGGKLGVYMRAPDGSTGIVPRENIVTALHNGGKLLQSGEIGQTRTEQRQAQKKPYYGFTPGNVVKNAVRGVSEMAQAIPQMASDVGGVVLPQFMGGDPITDTQLVKHIVEPMQAEAAKARQLRAEGKPWVGHAIASGIPGVGPYGAELGEQAGSGDVGGAFSRLGSQVAAAEVAPKVLGKAKDVTKKVNPRGALASRMTEVPPGEEFSRAEIVDTARNNGVNLDLAQATDSGVAQNLKKANRYSLASQGEYGAAETKNLAALDEWSKREASKYAPESASREVVGGKMQAALKQHLEARKNAATTSFKQLDHSVGGNLIDGTASVEAEARSIVSEMSDYYARHPELKPKQAWSIIENLAERPKVNTVNPRVTAEGLMDVNGQPVTATGTITKQPAPMHVFSWSELHQLRSDLMDFYRNNPDVIKGKSEAWLQRMVQTIDNSMTDASAGLSKADLETFRNANTTWESIKNTYDNPQSTYYHAIRAQSPSQLPGMLSKGSPELARSVRETLGSLEGDFQRQFVENLLNGKDGYTMDLKNLNSRVSRIPLDMLESMLGKTGARNLRMLGKVAQKITADANPSGTAKVGVPAAEVSGIFSNPVATAAELMTQYVGAKAMNSPKFLDYLTRVKKK